MPLRTARPKGRWGEHDPRPWALGSGAEAVSAEERRRRALRELPALKERAECAVARAKEARQQFYAQHMQLARLRDNLPFLLTLRGVSEKFVREAAEEAWVGDRVAEKYPLDCPWLEDEPAALVSLHKSALDRLTAQAQRGEEEVQQAIAALRSRQVLAVAAHRQAARLQEVADGATQALERCRSEFRQSVAPFPTWARTHEGTR